MVNRAYWEHIIETAWKVRSIIWLAGVRRVGKTRLCQSLPDCYYFDCELPRVRSQIEDIESFLTFYKNKRIILDEIHRLSNPSELLKIAADHYPHVKVIATGSSTLSASAKFSDTLAGRKSDIWLTPLIEEERDLFKQTDLKHRLLFGGLPPFFMSDRLPESDYQEWMDAYWAKDIQELFRVEKRYSFQKFTELIMARSGGIFEASKFTIPCEVSRNTITNYLNILEATYVAHVIRPFNTHRPTEIISMPKVYGFDTGFICYAKGWLELRPDDLGLLWEHYVLNEIQAKLRARKIFYWRDKQKHEIDFVLQKVRSPAVIAIECKLSASEFNPVNLKIFRKLYLEGENYVVATDVIDPYQKRYGDIVVNFVNVKKLAGEVGA